MILIDSINIFLGVLEVCGQSFGVGVGPVWRMFIALIYFINYKDLILNFYGFSLGYLLVYIRF